jgi:hypothetical protein
MLASVKYNPSSGHIRIGGKCVTAFHYAPDNQANHTLVHLPWGIKLEDCRMYHRRDERQSWDLPKQVGKILTDLGWSSMDGLGTPTGHLGRIVLRDSSDIGPRCLDVALDPSPYQSDIPVAFLQASICTETRLSQNDYGLWRFYFASTPDSSIVAGEDGYPAWRSCLDSSCSNCDNDDEYRGFWSPTSPGSLPVTTQPVSLPTDFNWTSKCDVYQIKKVAIPDDVASLNSACFCQEDPLMFLHANHPQIGTMIFNSQDDLPTSIRPKFPTALNATTPLSTNSSNTTNSTGRPRTSFFV